MSTRQRKIAVVGLPFYGHVMPILPLLKKLKAADYQVHYYNTVAFEWVRTETGADFYSYESTLNRYPPVDLMFTAYNEEIGFVLPQVAATILTENYDLIIYDEFCPWVKCLILTHAIPSICIHTTYAASLHDQRRPDKLIRGFDCSKADKDYIRDHGLSKHIVPSEYGRMLRFDLLSYLDEVVERNKRVAGISGFDGWALLSRKADEDIVLAPGFLVERVHKRDADYHYPGTFQNLKPPECRTDNLVYVSLGTSYGEIEPLLAAIEASTNDHGYKYVVSSGNRPAQTKTANPRIEIRPFVNQHEMLSRCAAFITHCGMNSVVEAVLTTTPMLLWPHSLEQRLTADALKKLGLGVFLENLDAKGADIEETIYEAATSESMRKKLQMYRQKIITAGGLGRAMGLIKQLLW